MQGKGEPNGVHANKDEQSAKKWNNSEHYSI
jgi:hypothetical protein